MKMQEFFMFLISTIGMCHIIVDSSLLSGFRESFKKYCDMMKLPKIGEIVECYMCCGTWCGFFMGFIWMDKTYDLDFFLKIFASGCAGGFISNFAAMILNWIEAATIVNMPDSN
jgi:hypothetical protein